MVLLSYKAYKENLGKGYNVLIKNHPCKFCQNSSVLFLSFACFSSLHKITAAYSVPFQDLCRPSDILFPDSPSVIHIQSRTAAIPSVYRIFCLDLSIPH